MKTILLTNGGMALVDDERYEELNAFKWRRSPQGYACRGTTQKRTVLMHRVVLGVRQGVVDHINRNTLDNRAGNLRQVDHSANQINRGLNSNNVSGFRNVILRKDTQKWRAGVMRNRRFISLGSYPSPEKAHEAVVKFKLERKEPYGYGR